MNNNATRRRKLAALGEEELADALLALAAQSEAAHDMVERMIATPQDNIRRVRQKIAALNRSKHFYTWHEAYDFAQALMRLLQDIRAADPEPCDGVRLVATFYETDEHTLGRCDDSSGHVGDVYRVDAKELFAEYAQDCQDKEALARLILDLIADDPYGVRDAVLENAADALPEHIIRAMIMELQANADATDEEIPKRHFLIQIESLARQIRDAELFERTRIASWGKMSPAAIVDIARVYFESGDVETARSRLAQFPPGESFRAHERDELLMDICRRTGDNAQLTELLSKSFRAYRCLDALQDLLDVLGEDKRDEVVETEVAAILAGAAFRPTDTAFLLDLGQIDEAERHILDRAEQLNGDHYASLLPLAEEMQAQKRFLAASLIYRSLLISILARGQSKTYGHGIRYLKKLDTLAKRIDDWSSFESHEEFTSALRSDHGRKYSFWGRYEGK